MSCKGEKDLISGGKCLNCGRSIMMPRIEFNRKLKKVEN